MTSVAPTPLTVRPRTRILMDTLVQATPSVPASYRPDLPELAASVWRYCRGSGYPVTVAEIAARLGVSPALAGVVVCDLAQLDLVRVVRFPALAARLRSWACGGRVDPPVPQVAKLLVVGGPDGDVRRCLEHLADTGILSLHESPRVDLAVNRITQDLHLVGFGVVVHAQAQVWADLCRDAFGALVVADPTTPEHTADLVKALREFGVALVVVVPVREDAEFSPEQIRATAGLTEDVPVVAADLDSPTSSAGGLMDLCTYLQSGGQR
ncbi:DUF742 domain-containing protein [Nocardiopsis sp. FR4]|uniref:DUF742 domain-containing protein n=1 Tax=Nocardiopsis sp. FR4 TaxID=2605985 RepID=UPI0013591DF5|nr:DUF742 domain-containing protein [Nocardiopsis sp. FR4]